MPPTDSIPFALRRLAVLASLSLGSVAGCANDHDIFRVDQEDTFYQEGTDEADILFVVDNSISMADEQELVAQGFDRFISAMGEFEVDFHLAIVTTDMDRGNTDRGLLLGDPAYLTPEDQYMSGFMDRVRVGIEGSDKERGLQAALHALSEDDVAEHNEGFMRESAVLALVFVSDENDCSDDNYLPDSSEGSLCYENEGLVTTAEYVRKYKGLKGIEGRVVASGIVGPDASAGCNTTWPGKRYMSVAEALDGVVGNICEADFGNIMDDIGTRISAPATVFYLSYAAVEETIQVHVDDEEILPDDGDGWTYDDEFSAIRFDGSYVPDFGSTIVVSYDIGGDR